jgi:hypothetical protein
VDSGSIYFSYYTGYCYTKQSFFDFLSAWWKNERPGFGGAIGVLLGIFSKNPPAGLSGLSNYFSTGYMILCSWQLPGFSPSPDAGFTCKRGWRGLCVSTSRDRRD